MSLELIWLHALSLLPLSPFLSQMTFLMDVTLEHDKLSVIGTLELAAEVSFLDITFSCSQGTGVEEDH